MLTSSTVVVRLWALVSVVAITLVCAGPTKANGFRASGWTVRRLQEDADITNVTAASNSTVANGPVAANVTSPVAVNATTAAANTTPNGTLATSDTSAPPPHAETTKEKIEEKWKNLGSQRTPAEKGVAITIGVIMLVSILTCLACCVFRRGGQWRIPGLQWFKKKFGPKDRYSRYADNDDGF
ncbi:hypothetical protein GPECTOR_2g1246 [Gonium pectorale]|uniref:Uncharacterized protein n=1 Tax=Gonium pectorale TaxID=33097 RepID=A0A150H0K2_GONPE|nr:hypothetical protein GPECTOR_2g1246 [Gonium pectorale]|eukprot:KXZ55696.1 hypothetical protein GPECTOR_2g1246 [Gonium pectorale]